MSICTCISDRQKKIDRLCEYHNLPISQEAATILLGVAKEALWGLEAINEVTEGPMAIPTRLMQRLQEAITAAEKGE